MTHEHGDGGQQWQEPQAVLHGGVKAAARGSHVGEGGNGGSRETDDHSREDEEMAPGGKTEDKRGKTCCEDPVMGEGCDDG